MRYSRILIPALLLAMATLTACGDGDETDLAAAGSSGGGGGIEVADDERVLDFYACMRQNGVEIADPDTAGGAQLDLSGLDADDPKTQAALDECRSLLPDGGEPAAPDAEGLAAMRAFTQCMRENGVNMPDPDADGGMSIPDDVDTSSTDFQSALGSCRDLLAGQKALVRGGSGG